MKRDPFASQYEVAIAILYPAMSLMATGLGSQLMAVVLLLYGMGVEIQFYLKAEKLTWGKVEQQDRWVNVFKFLLYNSSRGFDKKIRKLQAPLTGIVMASGFAALFQAGIDGIDYGLFLYAYLVPSIIWMVQYNSGVPSSASYTEYRKWPVRAVTISAFTVSIFKITYRDGWQMGMIPLLCATTAVVLELIRRRIHFDTEMNNILEKLEENEKIGPKTFPFHRVVEVVNNITDYKMVVPKNLLGCKVKEVDIPKYLMDKHNLVCLAFLCCVTDIRIPFRKLDLNPTEFYEYFKELVRIHKIVRAGKVPAMNTSDIMFIFSLFQGKSKKLNEVFFGFEKKLLLKIQTAGQDLKESGLTAAQLKKANLNFEVFLARID